MNISDDAIMDMLRRFDIFKEEINYNLDRGDRQQFPLIWSNAKVGFIRALLSRPEILILDEAMANLDEATKELVLSIYR